jgi:type II secretory pathway pseudopilin PulG
LLKKVMLMLAVVALLVATAVPAFALVKDKKKDEKKQALLQGQTVGAAQLQGANNTGPATNTYSPVTSSADFNIQDATGGDQFAGSGAGGFSGGDQQNNASTQQAQQNTNQNASQATGANSGNAGQQQSNNLGQQSGQQNQD